jgi:hypothetical protein
MAWFLRAIEDDEGRWLCCHGRHVFDSHDQLDEAVAHLSVIAADVSPAETAVHYANGTIRWLGPA